MGQLSMLKYNSLGKALPMRLQCTVIKIEYFFYMKKNNNNNYYTEKLTFRTLALKESFQIEKHRIYILFLQ